MPSTDIASLRAAYARASLQEEEIAADPIEQFGKWFQEAVEAGVPEPNACTLATVDADSRPAARIMLLKGFDRDGFTFYTNYESRKARELEQHPDAALVFWWIEVERQVRVEGGVARVSEAESETYFASRPRGSQLGAWASAQSQGVTSRVELERSLSEVTERFRDQPVPRPLHWGGYRVHPRCLEFWQGRPDRLHDRLLYTREKGGWRLSRLSP
jgi:pyridoxamine 5'-phosphate oxidase